MLAVRSPHQVADVGVVVLGSLDSGSGSGLIEIDLVLSGLVTDVGDILSVRTPGCSPLVGTGGLGDIPCDTLANRNVENLSTCGHSSPLSIRRDTESTAGDFLKLGTGIDHVGSQGDVDLLSLLRRRIEFIEETSLLEDDELAVGAGELDVEIREVGDLRGSLRGSVVHEYVHVHVAVGHEIDLIADPHREDILCSIVSDLLDALSVIDPNLVGHTATVVFPCTELPHDTVVSQFLPIGGETAESTLGKGNLLGHSTLYRNLPELAGETVTGPVTIDYVLSIISPGHDNVVRTHTVSQIITGVGGSVGQTHGLAAGSRDDVNFPVAIVFTGKCYGLPVRGIFREHLVADVGGKTLGLSTGKRCSEKISCVGEHDVCPVGCGEPEQTGLVCLRREGQGKSE